VCLIKVLNDGHGLAKVLTIDYQVGHQIVCGDAAIGRLLVLTLGNVDWDIFEGQALQMQCNSDAK
jgi:hypothetical protein